MPSSPQTSPGRHFQNSNSFPSWIKPLHSQLSGQFQGFLHHFVFFISVVWHRNRCNFFLLHRSSYSYSPCDVQASPHADTPTAEMIIQHGNNCGTKRQICFPRRFLRMLKNTGFLKSAFLYQDRLGFLFKARQRPFFGGQFGVLWAA